MKGFPRRGSNALHGDLRRAEAAASMKGFPRRGSNIGDYWQNAGTEWIASMKGFPRRGSNRMARSRRRSGSRRLNEGLPQKGKQCR